MDELSAQRRAELLDNGVQQSLPLLAAGYREVLDLSQKFKPLCDDNHTTDPYGEYTEQRNPLPQSDR